MCDGAGMRKSLSSLPSLPSEARGGISQCGIRAPRINFTLMLRDGIWGSATDLKHMLAPPSTSSQTQIFLNRFKIEGMDFSI